MTTASPAIVWARSIGAARDLPDSEISWTDPNGPTGHLHRELEHQPTAQAESEATWLGSAVGPPGSVDRTLAGRRGRAASPEVVEHVGVDRLDAAAARGGRRRIVTVSAPGPRRNSSHSSKPDRLGDVPAIRSPKPTRSSSAWAKVAAHRDDAPSSRVRAATSLVEPARRPLGDLLQLRGAACRSRLSQARRRSISWGGRGAPGREARCRGASCRGPPSPTAPSRCGATRDSQGGRPASRRHRRAACRRVDRSRRAPR